MKGNRAELNRFLVEVFDEILKTEEESLAGSFSDLSLRELHLIEEVCRAEDEARDNRATAIAAAQRVTAGTLTTAVSLLERKATWERAAGRADRRAVRFGPQRRPGRRPGTRRISPRDGGRDPEDALRPGGPGAGQGVGQSHRLFSGKVRGVAPGTPTFKLRGEEIWYASSLTAPAICPSPARWNWGWRWLRSPSTLERRPSGTA